MMDWGRRRRIPAVWVSSEDVNMSRSFGATEEESRFSSCATMTRGFVIDANDIDGTMIAAGR